VIESSSELVIAIFTVGVHLKKNLRLQREFKSQIQRNLCFWCHQKGFFTVQNGRFRCLWSHEITKGMIFCYVLESRIGNFCLRLADQNGSIHEMTRCTLFWRFFWHGQKWCEMGGNCKCFEGSKIQIFWASVSSDTKASKSHAESARITGPRLCLHVGFLEIDASISTRFDSNRENWRKEWSRNRMDLNQDSEWIANVNSWSSTKNQLRN